MQSALDAIVAHAAEAQACHVRSILCAPLWIDERRMGTLTLYSPKPAAFSKHDIQLIELFAALAAITLAEAQQADQLREAITSRDLIGQAKGIIMERYKATARRHASWAGGSSHSRSCRESSAISAA